MSSSQATYGAASKAAIPVRTVVSVLDLNPRKFGSMEEYMALLAEALRVRGWRCVFVLPYPVASEVLPHFEGTNAIFEIVPSIGGGGGLGSLRRVLRKYSGGIVHFHFFSPFSLYPIVARLSGCRAIIFTQHSRLSETPSRTRAWKGVFWDRCVLRPTGTWILTVAEHLKASLVNAYRLNPDRVRVVYTGVNLQRFQSIPDLDLAGLRKELAIEPASKVILAAAYLVPGKGMRDLVAAAPAVLRADGNALFIIAGDGPELEPLQTQARELGIMDRFRFPGLRSDVNRLMALAHAVVLPSVYRDTAPLVVVEAMASARPVIGTKVGGIPELVADGETGILVDPQAPRQIAAALLRLLSDPGSAAVMGAAGRKRAEKYFSAERWLDDTIALYENNFRQHEI